MYHKKNFCLGILLVYHKEVMYHKKVKKSFKNIIIFLVFIFLTLFIFRPIFTGLVPFSANLLVSTYNPWAKEKFPRWEVGIPNKPVGIDDLKIFYPQRHFTLEMLKKGEIPFWNPYNFSGNYHVGLSETAVFYPLFLLFSFIPQLTSWTIFIMLEPILIAIGMYLYLSLIMKDWRSAFFGSIVFAFSGVVVTRLEEGLSAGHALLWLPFVFYGIEAYLQKLRLRYLFLTLFSLASSLLAGWFQFTFYIFTFSLVYGLFRIIYSKQSFNRKILVFSPFILLPLVTLFHIIPSMQSFFDSLRGTQSEQSFLIATHLMPFSHLLTYIFPDFWGNPGSYNFFGKSMYGATLYIGLTPLIFSIFSLLWLRKDRITQFFLIMAIVTLFLGLNTIVSRFILSLPIPIISSFIPNRIFLITSFCLSILAAVGMEQLLSNYKKLQIHKFVSYEIKAAALILGLLASVIVFVDIHIFLSLISHSITLGELRNSLDVCSALGTGSEKCQLIIQARNIVLPSFLFFITALILILGRRLNSTTFFLLIALVTFAGQAYFADKSLAFSSPYFVFPRHPIFSYLTQNGGIDRFISTEEGHISANSPLMFRVFSPDGMGSMYPKRYSHLLKYVQAQGKIGGEASRVEVKILSSSKLLFDSKNPHLLRFMQIDGIKYIVKLKHEKETEKFITTGLDMFPLVWENDTWQIFEFRDVRPRFFWTNKYEVIKGEERLLKTLFAPQFDPKSLILEENPSFNDDPRSTGNVELLSYTPNRIVFKTEARGDGLLYLSDNYSSNFQVLIDNKESRLLRANYSFRAVAVPSGKHTVQMYYNSEGMVYAFFIAMPTLAVSLVLALYCAKRKIIAL